MTHEIEDTELFEVQAIAARKKVIGTLGEIQDRLNPRLLANEAMDAAKQRTSLAVRQARDSLAGHTVSIAVAGAAVGALFGARSLARNRKVKTMSQYEGEPNAEHPKQRLAGVKQAAGHAREALSEKAAAAREYTSDKLVSAREYTAETWETTRERAGEYAEKAKETAERARKATSEGVEHNPLTAVLIGAAAGAIIGALLPRTRREDRTMGEARERLADKARSAASAARKAGEARLDELGVKELAKEQLRGLEASAKDVARTAAEAARGAAQPDGPAH